MTAEIVQSVILILLFMMKVYTKTSIADIQKRGHTEEHYSMNVLMFHKLCSSCSLKDKFTRDINPVATQKHYIEPAKKLTQRKVKGQFINTKTFLERIPFVVPIDNLLKHVDYEIRKQFYDLIYQRLWKENMRQNQPSRNRKVVNETKKKSVLPQIKSTSTPNNRLIRSTVTERAVSTTFALPLSDTTTGRPTSETRPQITTVSTMSTQVPINTTKTYNEKTVMSKLPSNIQELTTVNIPQIYAVTNSSTTVIVPKFSSIHSNGYIENVTKKFTEALDHFERKYYEATFGKLSSISPPDRRENGISFVESGFFLFLMLNAISMEVDMETRREIERCLSFNVSDSDNIKTMQHVLGNLPSSSEQLKFRWSTRLVVNSSWHPTHGAGEASRMRVERILGNETPEQMLKKLNDMVEQDSGGAMRNTFEEEELSAGASAVLVNTVYARARWRAAPTLLNGTHAFRDADDAPPRTARMIRLNDIMRYADLTQWDAQAVEISYATPGLSLLLLVPRGRSLRALAEHAPSVSLGNITARMRPLRVAVTLPIYTLRMTLLLPNKLQAMGISRLVAPSNDTKAGELRLSHAVQRLMFWAEAGRNAFKDDGIEWDHRPELEMMVDRPYLFYLRWSNLTLMNGNFVL